MKTSLLVALLLLPCAWAWAQGDGGDPPKDPQTIPVRKEVVEWLLDMGKLWRGVHEDDQLVILRKVWMARDEHPDEIRAACKALAGSDKIEGELKQFYELFSAGADQRDPFGPSKDPDKDDIEKLLQRQHAPLLERTRAFVRFVRALDAQYPDQPAALEEMLRKHRHHPWLAAVLESLRRWGDFVKIRKRFAEAKLLPELPADARRVRVYTGAFEHPKGKNPQPLSVEAWLLKEDGDHIEVYSDFLERHSYELGSADVPADLAAFAGGPLPRMEDVDLEAAAYARLGAGPRSYIDRKEYIEAGGLTFGQETLLHALDLWRVGRRGLAVRLFELADTAHERDDDRHQSGVGLEDGFYAVAKVRSLQ